jgi:hypothetical protein
MSIWVNCPGNSCKNGTAFVSSKFGTAWAFLLESEAITQFIEIDREKRGS